MWSEPTKTPPRSSAWQEFANDAFGRAEADVLQVLQGVADRATSGPADRLFAAEAHDAIRFVERCAIGMTQC